MPCYQDWEYKYEDHGSYGDDYDSYSDHVEYDRGDPDPEPPSSEPNINEPEYRDDTHTFEDEGPGTKQAHWEGGHKGEVEGNEVYEHRQLKYEADEVHEHGELTCDDDKLRELEELKRMVNEDGYEPQGPNSRYEESQEPPQCAYKLEHELEYGNDRASEYKDRTPTPTIPHLCLLRMTTTTPA